MRHGTKVHNMTPGWFKLWVLWFQAIRVCPRVLVQNTKLQSQAIAEYKCVFNWKVRSRKSGTQCVNDSSVNVPRCIQSYNISEVHTYVLEYTVCTCAYHYIDVVDLICTAMTDNVVNVTYAIFGTVLLDVRLHFQFNFIVERIFMIQNIAVEVCEVEKP